MWAAGLCWPLAPHNLWGMKMKKKKEHVQQFPEMIRAEHQTIEFNLMTWFKLNLNLNLVNIEFKTIGKTQLPLGNLYDQKVENIHVKILERIYTHHLCVCVHGEFVG